METTLHQQLKRCYAQDEDSTEVVLGRYRIDAIRDGELISYQGDYSYFIEKRAEEESAAEQELLLAEREAKRLQNRDRQRKRLAKKRNHK